MPRCDGILHWMGGSISQTQMLYNPEEERVLFRINSTGKQEFRFWITRRYALLMLKILKEHRETDPGVATQTTPEAKKALQSFMQEKAMGQADFSKKFEEEADELPLGQDAQIAFKLNYGIKDGNFQLGVQPKEGQGISMVINQDLNVSLTQLLLAAAKKGDWRFAEWEASDPLTNERQVIN